MAKQSTEVSLSVLREAIVSAEESQSFDNMISMFKDVTTRYNQSKPPGYPSITPSVTRLRILNNHIPCKTEKGQGKHFKNEAHKTLLSGKVKRVPAPQSSTQVYKHEIQEIIKYINETAGKTYTLWWNHEDNHGVLHLSSTEQGPSLYVKEFKWYLKGLATGLGMTDYIDTHRSRDEVVKDGE